MKKAGTWILLGALAAWAPRPAGAQAFRGLGFLDPQGSSPYSRALGISADGTTVVGESQHEAFRWTSAAPTVLEPLGSLETGGASEAWAASADGSIVVGWSSTSAGNRAFRWTSGAGMASLGSLGAWSSAEDVSADGAVVVGGAEGGPGGFRWTSGGGMVAFDSLPFLNKGNHATAVSGDGQTAVGRGGCCEGGGVVSVRWPGGGTTPESLGDLSGTAAESPWGAAAGVSGDGLAVTGGGGGPLRAYRWSQGAMTELSPSTFPPPGGNDSSSGLDVSGGGGVIVGAASDPPGDPVSAPVGPIMNARAFVWTAADGMRSVEDVLAGLGLGENLKNWRLEAATGISDDGNVLVGFGRHNGVREGWVAALAGAPFPSTPPDDDGGGPYRPFRAALFFAALRESHGFLWHPTKGPIPIDPDPPPFLDPAARNRVRWIEGVAGPRAVEQLWAVGSETPAGAAELDLLRHDGRGWTRDWTSRGGGFAPGARGFDVAHEDRSGDALAVYEGVDGRPRYRTWSGGAWSEEHALPAVAARADRAGGDGDTTRWIELISRPGTDEIALASLDGRGRLVARSWDGERWIGEDASVVADRVADVGAGRPFGVAYEALSGALVAAWAEPGGVRFARRAGGSRAWERLPQVLTSRGDVGLVDLAAEPTSNLVAGAFVGAPGRGADVILSMWSGSRWHHQRLAAGARSPSTTVPVLPGAVTWVGTGRIALFAQAGAAPGALDWARWSEETGWRARPPIRLGDGQAPALSVRLAGSVDGEPTLALVRDGASRLHVLRYDEVDGWSAALDGPLAAEGVAGEAPFAAAPAREVVLLVGDPAAGRSRRGSRTGSFPFALVPRGEASRVEALAFLLDGVRAGGRHADEIEAALLVDADADGIVGADETTTVGGPGRVDSSGRLVFLEPFDVAAPTHLVLRVRGAGRTADRGRPLGISLSASGVVAPSGAVAGGAGARRPGR